MARMAEGRRAQEDAVHRLSPVLAEAANAICRAFAARGKVLFFGNGGSAADAQHLAAEFVGRYLKQRSPWAALALAANSSAVTAIGNDFGYDQVFERQVRAHGRAGDVAVGISTSGNSTSVVLALAAARELGMTTVAMTGRGGGRLAPHADLLLDVHSPETPRIQECHIFLGHVLCELVESELAGA